MKKITSIFIACCFVIAGFSQSIETYQLLNNDLDYLQNALYTSHPGTFKYTKKERLDSLFTTLKFTDNQNANTHEFEKKVRVVLNKVGCIHTSVKNTQFEFNKAIIPFQIFAKDHKIWIKEDLADHTFSLTGYQILNINGNSAKDMIDILQNFRASDGYNKTFKYQLMNTKKWFNKQYQYYFDTDSIKSYTLVTPQFDTIVIDRKNIIVENKDNSNHEEKGIHFGDDIILNFDSIHHIAVLKIKSFSTIFPVIGSIVNKMRYKKAMKMIEQSGYENLVIDLRDNLGGSGPAGNVFLSFFVDKNHHYYATRNKGKIFRYATIPSKFGVVFNFFAGNIFAQRWPTWTARKSISKVKKSKRHHFKGHLFVITNGLSVSTTAIVASTLKYKSDAILIGEETGGGAASMNGYFYPTVKLPFSKIKISFPQYDIDLNVVKNTGYGVKPNVPVNYTIDDILNERDLEMNAIFELVSQNKICSTN